MKTQRNARETPPTNPTSKVVHRLVLTLILVGCAAVNTGVLTLPALPQLAEAPTSTSVAAFERDRLPEALAYQPNLPIFVPQLPAVRFPDSNTAGSQP